MLGEECSCLILRFPLLSSPGSALLYFFFCLMIHQMFSVGVRSGLSAGRIATTEPCFNSCRMRFGVVLLKYAAPSLKWMLPGWERTECCCKTWNIETFNVVRICCRCFTVNKSWVYEFCKLLHSIFIYIL